MGNTPLKSPEDVSDEILDRSNIALIFIKPHAVKDEVKAFVSGEIVNRGLTVLCEGEMSAEDIESKGCIDKHYASIAKSAMETAPGDLDVTDEKKKEFMTKFGTEWDSALELGLIFNAKQAAEKLGSMEGDELVPMSGSELDKLWASNSSARVKLAPGLYVENVNEDEPMYVINGFYMAMREKYVTGNGIYYYVVGWDSKSFSWEHFRANIIGATDPTVADAGSIRGKMLATWEEGLDLDRAPDVGDNGVHASAGPIEGLKERTVWLGYDAAEDPFGEKLISWTGGKAETIAPWLDDAVVEESKNYGLKGKMFDLTEDKDTPWALMFCNNLALA